MNVRIVEPPVGGTIDHILSVLPSLVPSAQRVARICADQPSEVVEMSGADLAAAANTSAATVSRTCQALGFRSFQHLRLLLVRDLGASAGHREARPEGTAGWLRALTDRVATSLPGSVTSVDADAFDAAADAIAVARRVLVVGTGGSSAAAQTIAFKFLSNGRSCEAPADGVSQQFTASVLAPGDVCLAISATGSNSITMAAAAAAAGAGATVVGVTSFAKSRLAEYADHLLVAGARFHEWDDEAVGVPVVQVMLLSALALAVAERTGEVTARAREAIRGELYSVVSEADETI